MYVYNSCRMYLLHVSCWQSVFDKLIIFCISVVVVWLHCVIMLIISVNMYMYNYVCYCYYREYYFSDENLQKDFFLRGQVGLHYTGVHQIYKLSSFFLSPFSPDGFTRICSYCCHKSF